MTIMSNPMFYTDYNAECNLCDFISSNIKGDWDCTAEHIPIVVNIL